MQYRGLDCRGTRDRGFDQHIVRPADHDQMFDIVAPYQHELALPIEIEHIDDGEPRLAPATVLDVETLAVQDPAHHGNDDDHDDDEYGELQQNGDELIVAKKTTDIRHAGRAPLLNCRTNNIHCSTTDVPLSHKVNEWLISNLPDRHWGIAMFACKAALQRLSRRPILHRIAGRRRFGRRACRKPR